MTNPTESSGEPAAQFFAEVHMRLGLIRDKEAASIAVVADLLSDQIARNRLIHVFGVSGHSGIGCEEFFWRAGGICNINPLFDHSLNLSGGGLKSTQLERVPGIGDKAIRASIAQPDEVLIITSIYGMNAATIDAAVAAKEMGLKLVAITSKEHSGRTPLGFVARHPSGRNLVDLADVVIDNHVPYGDTVVSVAGCPQAVGFVNTALVSACIQWLVIETVAVCVRRGLKPKVWQSANTVGGDERNASYIKEFFPRVKAL
jgi:uncharacterized phosphosugar-binding protein